MAQYISREVCFAVLAVTMVSAGTILYFSTKVQQTAYAPLQDRTADVITGQGTFDPAMPPNEQPPTFASRFFYVLN